LRWIKVVERELAGGAMPTEMVAKEARDPLLVAARRDGQRPACDCFISHGPIRPPTASSASFIKASTLPRRTMEPVSLEPNKGADVSPKTEASQMRRKSDAIEHCRRHIERVRTEMEKREALGQSTERLRNRLKTLEALRAAHEAARGRSDAA
jgi:hypothetical protein